MILPANESPDLTELERSVLETAFSTGGVDTGFREQIDVATVSMRTPSGVGFVTKLCVPDGHGVADSGTRGAVPVVKGEHPELPSGADFILQVKNGRINCIEAFCYEGIWPTDETQFRIHVGS